MGACAILRLEDVRLVVKGGEEEHKDLFFHHGEGLFSWMSGETLQGAGTTGGVGWAERGMSQAPMLQCKDVWHSQEN